MKYIGSLYKLEYSIVYYTDPQKKLEYSTVYYTGPLYKSEYSTENSLNTSQLFIISVRCTKEIFFRRSQ